MSAYSILGPAGGFLGVITVRLLSMAFAGLATTGLSTAAYHAGDNHSYIKHYALKVHDNARKAIKNKQSNTEKDQAVDGPEGTVTSSVTLLQTI